MPYHVCSFDSFEVKFKREGSEVGKQFLNFAVLSNLFTVRNKIWVGNMCVCLPHLIEDFFAYARQIFQI